MVSATRLLRYALFLLESNFSIKYRPTNEHGNADFLSRLPTSSKELPKPESDATDELHIIYKLTVLPLDARALAKETERDEYGRELLLKLYEEVS